MMNNPDTRQQAVAQVTQAIKDGNEQAAQTALLSLFNGINEQILEQARQLAGETDAAVLASRGVRQLTQAETKYYTAVLDAIKSDTPKQALTNISVAMPQTIIDAVMDDITSTCPLLGAISFQNTTALTKWIYNKQGVQSAKWGPITAAFTEELSGSFGVLDVATNSLKAFFVVPKDYIILGPAWLDRYVRAVLAEANMLSLEAAIVDGTGKDQPIGMTRSVADDVTVTGGVYPRKTAEPLTGFTPAAYLPLIAKLAKTPTGRQRAVDHVTLVVNPTDYFAVVRPATTILTTMGNYIADVFPFPTTVYQSAAVPTGHAILGLANRYFMGLGTSKDGLIEYDDSVKFLSDERVYTSKLLGNGRPMDDNAFVYLDITGLERVVPEVAVKGVVRTKAEA